MKNEFGQVIPVSVWRKSGGNVVLSNRTDAEQTVKALVYHEQDDYIVTFGQPPYLWRRHSSLEEVEQTYFYYDWSEPPEDENRGNGPVLIGKM